MTTMTYGLDIAKSVFQLYGVDVTTGEVSNRKLSRDGLLAHFSNHAPCRIVLEACGGAHWWAHTLGPLGHEVKLINPRFVRPFVQNNKSDAADARAIWTASQQPEARFVTPKSIEQQALKTLHALRQGVVKERTMLVNRLRGLLGEFGLHFPQKPAGLRRRLQETMAEVEQALPPLIWPGITRLLTQWSALDDEIESLEHDLKQAGKDHEAIRRLQTVPGIGPLTASALVATMGDPGQYGSGRDFAASLGLVPRHSGSGGKVKLGGISKRGDPYLRSLLVHGARTVVSNSKTLVPWVEALLERRPKNVAVVAVANKMARIAWALLAHGDRYETNPISRQRA